MNQRSTVRKPRASALHASRKFGQAASDTPRKRAKGGWWERQGGGSLSISIVVHAALLLLAIGWLVTSKVMKQPAENVDFLPNGGGGGNSGKSRADNLRKSQSKMMMSKLPRIAAQGAGSSVTLPELDPASLDISSSTLASTSLATMGSGQGRGGGGNGEGKGMGTGNGAGSGIGQGLNPGMVSPFGIINAGPTQLRGNIFDFYHLKNGKPSEHPQNGTGAAVNNLAWMTPVVTSFIEKGWRESQLKSYFCGPATLSVTQILIPRSPDTAAPQAFQAGGKMTGGAWIVVYSGTVVAPESSEIRFVGGADNYLAVRLNRRNVLAFACGDKPSEVVDKGLRMPLSLGSWTRVEKGRSYEMQILIGDAGGLFSAFLCYEKKDQPGKLFLFRTKQTDFMPIVQAGQNEITTDIEADSPVWQAP